MNNFLIECLNKLGVITIDDEFIKYRNEMKEKFIGNGRTEEKRLMDADCLIIEYMMIKNNLVDKPVHKGHDIIKDGVKIDFKVIDKWFSASWDKVNWYKKCINAKQLDLFAFFKYKSAPKRPLQSGDKVEFDFIDIQDSNYVLSKLRPSQYNGYYYGPF